MAQAGGAGGFEHTAATGTATSRDAQPASAVSNSSAKPLIFSKAICPLLQVPSVEIRQGFLCTLLFFQRPPGLSSTSVRDGCQISLMKRCLGSEPSLPVVRLPEPSPSETSAQPEQQRNSPDPACAGRQCDHVRARRTPSLNTASG